MPKNVFVHRVEVDAVTVLFDVQDSIVINRNSEELKRFSAQLNKFFRIHVRIGSSRQSRKVNELILQVFNDLLRRLVLDLRDIPRMLFDFLSCCGLVVAWSWPSVIDWQLLCAR